MDDESQQLPAEEVTALYAAHADAIYRFLLGMLRDSSLAGDCVQAAFAKLVERGRESRPETRRAWLFKVAYQEAMLAKRRGATGGRVIRASAWRTVDEHAPPEAALFRRETTDKVREVLERLPEDQRRVVRMRIYEEKTFAEIAAELKIPLGTALGRMRTALQKLKAALGEETP